MEFYFLEPHFPSFQAALLGFHKPLEFPIKVLAKQGIITGIPVANLGHN